MSLEVAFDQVAQNETAYARISGVCDMFPKPSKAAVQAVIFDIGLGGRLRFHRPVGAEGTNPTLLYRPKKRARRFLRAVCAYLKRRR
jgi:hypothetical protein